LNEHVLDEFNRQYEIENKPTNTFPCGKCGKTLERYRGDTIVSCPDCGSDHNSGGQIYRDNWRANMSNYDDELSDLDGFEQAELKEESYE
jgi:uncharacterized CHY-type Zn-finger protein